MGTVRARSVLEVLLRWFDAGLVALHQDVDHTPEALADPTVASATTSPTCR